MRSNLKDKKELLEIPKHNETDKIKINFVKCDKDNDKNYEELNTKNVNNFKTNNINYDLSESKLDLFNFLDSSDVLSSKGDGDSYKINSLNKEETNNDNNEDILKENETNNSFASNCTIFNNLNYENSIYDTHEINNHFQNSSEYISEPKEERNNKNEEKLNGGMDYKMNIEYNNCENKNETNVDNNINNINNIRRQRIWESELKIQKEINIKITSNNSSRKKLFKSVKFNKDNASLIQLDESEYDNLSKKEAKSNNKSQYQNIPKSTKIKKEKYYYGFGWSLCFHNILLDKYVLAFSLMIDRKYPPVRKFLVYRGIKDTFAFIELTDKIPYNPNLDYKLLFKFNEYIPEVKSAKSWRCHFNNIIINNTWDYFSNIDIKNAIKPKRMRQNMFFNKDQKDQDEIYFYDILKMPKIKKAFYYVKNIAAQKKCDYNRKCYWITCDKSVDLDNMYDLNGKDIYIKSIDYSLENYCDQKIMVIILKEGYSKEIYSFLKKWTDNGRVNLDNDIYGIVPVHNKVLIFSYFSINDYFKEDLSNEFILDKRFKNLFLKSGKDIKKLIEEINKEI